MKATRLFLSAIVLPLQLIAQAVVTPGDNLVIDGIPPIPAAVADAVGRYTEFRSASFQSWHPERREMLISTRFADVPQIHYVKMPAGDRTQLTFFPERVAGATFNPIKPDCFVFSKDVSGSEWFQNYRYDLATGDITLLTDGKSRNSLGVWSRDGKWMAYTSTRRNGKDVDIYLIDPAKPRTDRLLAQLEGGGWGPLSWSPDGKTILVGEYISVNESYLWLFEVQTGTKVLLTPKGGKEQVAFGGGDFSPDGKGIYLTTDMNSEFRRLAYFDLSTRKFRFMTGHIKWDIDGFAVAPDGKTIAFVANEDGIGVLRLVDAASGKELPLPKLPTGIVSGIEWHPRLGSLAFNLSSSRSATDVYTLDFSRGTVQRWTQSETGIPTEHFPEAELIKWKTFDGRIISGFLYRPPAKFTGKRPVMVVIHGGPEGQSRPGFLGRNNYYLNEMGLVLIYPNIRGSSGYGKTFLKLDNGFHREDSYKDLAALFDWIKTQPSLDGDRILATGGSYGGHATLAVASLYADKIRCGVDVVGMSNLVTFLERTESYRRDLRRVEYGDERDPDMRAYLEKIAPMNNLLHLTKPLLVVQGQNDPRCPVTESEQIVKALKESKTPVWYLMARDEGHGFSKKKNQDFQFYSTVLFLQEYLVK